MPLASREGAPGNTQEKSDKIEEDCDPVPGWAFSLARVWGNFGYQWVATIVSVHTRLRSI